MQIVNDNLIKKWEKLELEAYLPTPNDVWTIGWGHTHTTKPGMVITVKQAQDLFDRDTAWVEAALKKYVKVPLTQNQYDALASLVFNIGEGAFAKSTLLRKLNAKDYEGAANEFPRWNKQAGKVLRGLVRRRAEEMEYFLKPSGGVAQKVDAPTPMKPLTTSKETVGGLLVSLVGAAGVALPELDEGAVKALSVALVAIGILFVVNRVIARYKGQR